MAHKLLKSEENTHKDVSEVLYKCEGHILNVVITAANTRTLRLKVNAFYETCYLVSSILEEFISFVQS
ncbi:hypothetical protein X943_003692 [Babesia divergens]|uniref:Uncharacterized protein n=1 Tax=Babesia divergens TaxID=32595 RepID=A0AAD9LHH5_BABDI|nr:hypothetical protein X943_003692 [Babesia divergens]